MKKPTKIIPKQFLEQIPHGLKYVQRSGYEYLVVESVFCPNGHSIMSEHVKLHGEQSIEFNFSVGDANGRLTLDAYWGSHDKLYNFIPDLTHIDKVTATCPICHTSLLVQSRPCKYCGGTNYIQMLLPGGKNRILSCAKLGCPEHEIDIIDFPMDVVDQISNINYFGS